VSESSKTNNGALAVADAFFDIFGMERVETSRVAGNSLDEDAAADEALIAFYSMRPFARRATAAVIGTHVPGPHSNAWGSARRMRLSGKQRLSRTRERARECRAKMRGRRGADKMRLRGGTIDAKGGLYGFAWWVDTPRADESEAPDEVVWRAALGNWYDDEAGACLYCTDGANCNLHPFPF